VSAATRRLDRHDVTGFEVAGHLRRQALAVQGVAPHGAGLAAALSLRRMLAALADNREATGLEDAELADDAVATVVSARAPGAEA
jgi:hypothetical protein